MPAVTGSFTASGQSGLLGIQASRRPNGAGAFNITISGTFSASMALERQFTGDATWYPITYPDGTAVTFTLPVSTTWEDPEQGVSYRLNCTYTSGTANYRLSQ